MRPRIEWTEMRWSFDTPATWWPLVIERLRSTPARCLAQIARLNEATLKAQPTPESWSMLQHVGHLAILDGLWSARLDDFAAGAATLREADLTNQATNAADFNSQPMLEVFKQQAAARQELMQRLEAWGEADRWEIASQHPRLGVTMRVIDHAVFAADHDDYHLAQLDDLRRVSQA